MLPYVNEKLVKVFEIENSGITITIFIQIFPPLKSITLLGANISSKYLKLLIHVCIICNIDESLLTLISNCNSFPFGFFLKKEQFK